MFELNANPPQLQRVTCGRLFGSRFPAHRIIYVLGFSEMGTDSPLRTFVAASLFVPGSGSAVAHLFHVFYPMWLPPPPSDSPHIQNRSLPRQISCKVFPPSRKFTLVLANGSFEPQLGCTEETTSKCMAVIRIQKMYLITLVYQVQV